MTGRCKGRLSTKMRWVVMTWRLMGCGIVGWLLMRRQATVMTWRLMGWREIHHRQQQRGTMGNHIPTPGAITLRCQTGGVRTTMRVSQSSLMLLTGLVRHTSRQLGAGGASWAVVVAMAWG